MKVTYNWLKDFVKITLPPQVLADKLTMAGLEVTALEGREGDFVLEIEVTSNRPDCLSVMGIAREVAAVTGGKLNHFPISPLSRAAGKKTDRLKINIEDKKDCPLYTAKIIKDVKVGPSPQWLQKRLELVGCRSVNNVVDVTNYILFTYGEPLHAFDLDKLRGETIIVRRAKDKERITAIDGEEKMLGLDILVIADAERPVAIAGIMGGEDTEVSQNTTNILLEAAVFNPLIIRRARQKLGLQSESAYRFERGVDLETAERAAWQAVDLIQKMCGGRCILAKSSGLTRTKNKTVNLDIAFVNKVLGTDIEPGRIKKTINSLEFKAKIKSRNNFIAEIPAHRPDVNLAIDLVEEIARIYGYEHIPTTLPRVSPYIAAFETRDTIALIKNILVGLGLNEVITYSLVDQELLKGFCEHPAEPIEIANPLSQEQGALRPALMLSLSQCVAYNLRQKRGYINIFEIAKTYAKTNDGVSEGYMLGIVLCGTQSRWGWTTEEYKEIQEEVRLEHLQGILEALFQRLGFKFSFKEKEREYKFISAGNNYSIEVQLKDRKTGNYFNIGALRRLQRQILDRLDIKNKAVFAAEINLDKLCQRIRTNREIKPPLKYPGITRDTTFELKDDITLEQVYDAIANRQQELLEEAKFTVLFEGPQVPVGYKRMTISFRYYSTERTLTEAEINAIHSDLVKGLQERFQAKVC